MTDLKTELEQMASAIVKEASAQGDDAPSFEQKVDALDKLTRLYIAFQKHPHEGDEDEDSGFSFEHGITASPQAGQSNGSAAAPGTVQRRRRATGPSSAGN